MRLLYAFAEPLPLPKARGIQVAWMVDSLCASGVDVLLAHVPSERTHPLLPLGKKHLPANLLTIPIARNWPFPFQRWHSVVRFTHRLLNWIDRHPNEAPDIVFVRHLKLAYRLLQTRPDLCLIYEAHEGFAAMAPASKKRKLAAQEAYVLAHAQGVVFISAAVQSALKNEYAIAGRQIVLHSGVNLPEMLPIKDWANCKHHIIYAGSFFPWKGVSDLIAAAASLPGFRITLIGGSAEEIAKLHEDVSEGGAEVVLLPRLPANQVMAYLQAACVAVLPNRAEGVSQFTSPLKLFEYMGAACAIVATDLPSIREVLPAEGVTWCSPGDPASLATALVNLTKDPVTACTQGTALRQLAKKHTWTSRAQALIKFADSLLPRMGGAIDRRTENN